MQFLSKLRQAPLSGQFIFAYHAVLLAGLPFYFYYAPPGWGLVAFAAGLLFLTQLGIGGAYHRYYSHCGYTLNPLAEGVLLLFATLALQGSALRWSFEHRLHHAYVDTDRDPYSIRKGFWYAHVLWLLEPGAPIDESRVRDLLSNPLVRFQHRYYAWLSFGSNALVGGLAGWAFGDLLGGFVLVWWTRLMISHHLTWFINSLAHCWGSSTYTREHSAVDNFVIALLTVGEGYHNFHHTFASDYRNGVRWYHFDPTKWTIWTLSKLGLAANLKRYSPYAIKRRLLSEDRRLLLDALRRRPEPQTAGAETRKVTLIAERIQSRLARMSALVEEIRGLKKRRADKALVRRMRNELRDVRRGLRADWRFWSDLCRRILVADGAHS